MKYTVLTLFIASLLLVSCGPTQQTGDLTDPFLGGTEGLAMAFMAGSPPTEIIDAGKYPFTVSMMIKNLGESDIGPESVNSENTFARVQILGINPVQFGSPETEKFFGDGDVMMTLTGAKRNFDSTVIAGGQNVITFNGFNYQPDAVGNHQLSLQANLCYDYMTYSNTQICIKDNVLETTQDNTICTIAGQKVVKNSGAPVHVTTASENPMTASKIQVMFTIENVGKGQIFRRVGGSHGGLSSNEACNINSIQDKNIVYVTVSLSDDYATGRIECPLLNNQNEGEISLYQGAAATVVCTIDTTPSENRVYTDVLRVNLEYTYLDFITTPLLVKDVSTN